MSAGLFAIAAAIVGSGVAAAAGVWLTIVKLRRERAFDRQLEDHQSAFS